VGRKERRLGKETRRKKWMGRSGRCCIALTRGSQSHRMASDSIVAVKSDSGHNKRLTEPGTVNHHADQCKCNQPAVFN